MAGTGTDNVTITVHPVASLGNKCKSVGFDGSNMMHKSTGFGGHNGSISQNKNNKDDTQQTELGVFPLPEGWPRLQEKLFKRRNLYFQKPTSPSISKAIQHLQKLQDNIEAWSHEMELEILSRRSSSLSNIIGGPSYEGDRRGLGSKLLAGHRHLQFTFGSAYSKLTDLESEADTRASSKLSSVPSDVSGLSVRGTGASVPKGLNVLTTIEIPDDELPKLGAEEVIDEVLTLLGKLEADRQDTDETLEKEQQRVDWLQGKIDRLAHKRLVELPKTVQKEHENCSIDIAELKWHSAYSGRLLARIKSKVVNAQMLNSRLNEDIAFVKKHCPLVEEKLELEMEAMKRIDEAQDETTRELNKTMDKMKKARNKSYEAHAKADMERTHIKKELDAVRDALSEINSELDEAKALHTSYCHMCNDLSRTLLSNAQEKIVLETRIENSRTAEKMEVENVKQAQEMIIDAEFQHRRLADNNYHLNIKIDITKEKNKKLKEVADIANKKRLKDLRFRQHRCNEMTMDIEDIEVKLKQCTKQRVDDAKNTERIKREMIKLETQLVVVDEEHTDTRVIKKTLKTTFLGEKDKVAVKEEQRRTTIEALMKHLKEETQNRTVLQGRILADNADLKNLQMDARRSREKVSKKYQETEDEVAELLNEVIVQRETKVKRLKTVDDLETAVGVLEVKHLELDEKATKTTLHLEPMYKNVQEDYLQTQQKLDHMKSRTDFMCKKLGEQSQSENFMDRVIKRTTVVIEELNEELEEETIKLETGQHQEQDLKQSLNEVSERTGLRDLTHWEQMKTRQHVLEEHENELKEQLQTNKNLATAYRLLQQNHYKLKTDLLTEFEVRVGLEASLKDHKQIKCMQIRLHDALTRYFTLRGLYHKNELNGFENSSVTNGERIRLLQNDMEHAIHTITTFLSDQLDGTAIKMVIAAANSALTKSGNDEKATLQDARNEETVGQHGLAGLNKQIPTIVCT